METNSPIIVVDDDEDDQELFGHLIKNIAPNHPVLYFRNGQQVIDYLSEADVRPFVIFSEVTMQVMNGIELRKKIEADPQLKMKAIPFIFLTHPVYRHQVEAAYGLTIQGYFEKSANIAQLEEDLTIILSYWRRCLHPNRYIDHD